MKKIYVYKEYISSLEDYKNALTLLASLAYYKGVSSNGYLNKDHLNYKAITLQFRDLGLDAKEINMMLDILKEL